MSSALDAWKNVALGLRGPVEKCLEPGESPIAWFETDLDIQLRYSPGLVVITDRRILTVGASDSSATSTAASPENVCQAWNLDQVISLESRQRGSVGTLEMMGASKQLAHWRYTVARTAGAHRLVEQFKLRSRAATSGESSEEQPVAAETTCPSCGAVLAADQYECPVCAPSPPLPPAKSFYRLAVFARPWLGLIVLGLFLTLTSTAIGLVPAYLVKPLIDDVLVPLQDGRAISRPLVAFCLGGFAVAAFVAWGLSWAKVYVIARLSEFVAADLRDRIYAHLHSLSLEYYSAKRTGDLISRVSSDTDRICYFLSVYMLDALTDVVMVVLTIVLLAFIDPMLTFVGLCPLPLIGLLIYRVRCRLRRGFHLSSRVWAEMTSVLADTIPGIRVVKAFAQEKREIERFRQVNRRVFDVNNRVNQTWSYFGPTVGLMTDLGTLVIWGFGTWQILHQHIQVGALVVFVSLIGRFYTRLDSMSRMMAAIQRAAASTQRIFEILDRAPSVAEPVRPVPLDRVRGEVEFRGVEFRYGNRPIIEKVDLSIACGEMIGLVGHSGAGKSTLVNLLCRFYDVTGGSILVDGVDIRSFSIPEYRRNIGIVLQDPFLFYGTVAENIAYGRPDATREQIIEAARAAKAHDFILRLPDAYDSIVGERGQSLSGGERQRIGIARAILIDPRILILDEATSSVDTETEREIQEAFDNLVRGRTTVAIAHRLSTLRKASRLVVLDRGRIREMGLHDDLLARKGIYARLYRAQQEMAGLDKGKGRQEDQQREPRNPTSRMSL